MIGRLVDKISFYLLLILIISLGFSLFRNVEKVRRVDAQIKLKEKEVERVKKEGDDLAAQLQIVQSPEYRESQLRNKLGLAKEGEIVVILPPEAVLRSIAPKFEREKELLPDPNWKRWVKMFL